MQLAPTYRAKNYKIKKFAILPENPASDVGTAADGTPCSLDHWDHVALFWFVTYPPLATLKKKSQALRPGY